MIPLGTPVLDHKSPGQVIQLAHIGPLGSKATKHGVGMAFELSEKKLDVKTEAHSAENTLKPRTVPLREIHSTPWPENINLQPSLSSPSHEEESPTRPSSDPVAGEPVTCPAPELPTPLMVVTSTDQQPPERSTSPPQPLPHDPHINAQPSNVQQSHRHSLTFSISPTSSQETLRPRPRHARRVILGLALMLAIVAGVAGAGISVYLFIEQLSSSKQNNMIVDFAVVGFVDGVLTVAWAIYRFISGFYFQRGMRVWAVCLGDVLLASGWLVYAVGLAVAGVAEGLGVGLIGLLCLTVAAICSLSIPAAMP